MMLASNYATALVPFTMVLKKIRPQIRKCLSLRWWREVGLLSFQTVSCFVIRIPSQAIPCTATTNSASVRLIHLMTLRLQLRDALLRVTSVSARVQFTMVWRMTHLRVLKLALQSCKNLVTPQEMLKVPLGATAWNLVTQLMARLSSASASNPKLLKWRDAQCKIITAHAMVICTWDFLN